MRKQTESRIADGARTAVLRLVEKAIRNSGELIVFRDGKIITIKARDIRLK